MKKMIARAKKRGIVTIDEINAALPAGPDDSEQIEDIMSALERAWASRSSRMTKPTTTRTRRTRPAPEDEVDPLDDGGPRPAAATKKEADRPHRRPGPHVPARDGRGRIALPRGRDRHRQAHRGRPRHHDLGPVRKPDHLRGDHRLVQRPQRRPHAAARDPRPRGDAVARARPPSRSPHRARKATRRRRRDQREDRRPVDQGRGRGRRRAPRRRRGRGRHGRAAHQAAGRGRG